MIRAGFACAVALLAACAPMVKAPAPDPTAAVGEGAWLLPGTDWRLVEMNGAAASGVAATLTADGRVVGRAQCNRFTAPYAGRWPDLTFAPAASTRMACPELAAETEFFAALGAVDHAALDEDGLTLTGPGGVALRFVRS